MCTRRRSPWSQFTLPACLPARLSTSQRTTDHRPIRLFVRVHPAGVVLSASLYVYAQNSRFFYYTWGDDKNGGVYVAKLVGWLALLNVEVFLLLEFGKSADILFRWAGTWICLFLILIWRWSPVVVSSRSGCSQQPSSSSSSTAVDQPNPATTRIEVELPPEANNNYNFDKIVLLRPPHSNTYVKYNKTYAIHSDWARV